MAKLPGRVRDSAEIGTRKIYVMVAAVIGGMILIGLIIPVTAMQFENHNGFCASCHTQEQTFYERSIASTPVDLGSTHNINGQARCIDCHTGPGTLGRFRGLMAGATNLIAYFSGHYSQPPALHEPYPDANCLKCHATIAQNQEFNNHYHIYLPRWQAIDKNAATCVSCHRSHDTQGNIKLAFLNQKTTLPVCQKCHDTLWNRS